MALRDWLGILDRQPRQTGRVRARPAVRGFDADGVVRSKSDVIGLGSPELVFSVHGDPRVAQMMTVCVSELYNYAGPDSTYRMRHTRAIVEYGIDPDDPRRLIFDVPTPAAVEGETPGANGLSDTGQAAVFVSLPTSFLRVWARNDAAEPIAYHSTATRYASHELWDFSSYTVGEDTVDMLKAPTVTAWAAYGSTPSRSRLFYSQYLVSPLDSCAANQAITSQIPAHAKSFILYRQDMEHPNAQLDVHCVMRPSRHVNERYSDFTYPDLPTEYPIPPGCTQLQIYPRNATVDELWIQYLLDIG